MKMICILLFVERIDYMSIPGLSSIKRLLTGTSATKCPDAPAVAALRDYGGELKRAANKIAQTLRLAKEEERSEKVKELLGKGGDLYKSVNALLGTLAFLSLDEHTKDTDLGDLIKKSISFSLRR